jgi:hypothetical protein
VEFAACRDCGLVVTASLTGSEKLPSRVTAIVSPGQEPPTPNKTTRSTVFFLDHPLQSLLNPSTTTNPSLPRPAPIAATVRYFY